MKIDELKTFKQSAEKITCLTAYDASFAQLFDECGIDVILVGEVKIRLALPWKIWSIILSRWQKAFKAPY